MSSRNFKKILVTGGAGFMGSAFIRHLLQKGQLQKVVNLDLLTYAGNIKNLAAIENDPRYLFVHGDILSGPLIEKLLDEHQIEAIVHFAAESHVDRSIADPNSFYRTNVEGTITLLEALRKFPHIHFHHISTDEVYGSLTQGDFHEESPYSPNSPYAASKAASDHFVRAYAHTYNLSVTLSHSSNNYGPCQNLEKFIPRMIAGCLNHESLPVYGTGVNVRDWIFVEDHARAVWHILQHGKKGENYNIGVGCQLRNIDLLHLLIEKVAKQKKESPQKYHSLITYVKDRPGHDLRYALNTKKLSTLESWRPLYSLESGLDTTIAWYLHAH